MNFARTQSHTGHFAMSRRQLLLTLMSPPDSYGGRKCTLCPQQFKPSSESTAWGNHFERFHKEVLAAEIQAQSKVPPVAAAAAAAAMSDASSVTSPPPPAKKRINVEATVTVAWLSFLLQL
jgi:hypothetical protein